MSRRSAALEHDHYGNVGAGDQGTDGLGLSIPLVGGGTAVVDRADESLVAPLRWYRHPQGYAAAKVDGRWVLMHRLIMGVTGASVPQVDHSDHDKLNNRRGNLRLCTPAENQANRAAGCGVSEYKGVTWDGARGIWRAQAGGECGGYIGRYANERDAALAYDAVMRARFGEFASPNIGDDQISVGEALARRVMRPKCSPRGAANHNAVLTEALVRAIRASALSAPKLARELGITASSISGVRQGRTWRHVV